jgi:anti-sigma factor RsiW
MSDALHIADEQLHALIDGELNAADRAQVESAIAADAYLAHRVEQFRGDKERLAQVYGPIAEQPLPARWIEMIERAPRRPRSLFSIEAIAGIAAAIIITIGSGLYYKQATTPHEEPIVEEALAARDNALPVQQSVKGIAAANAAANHTLASALAMNVSAPDLHRMGYTLVGLRVYGNVPRGKSVELLYRHSDHRLFALYLRHPTGAPRFDQYKQGALRVCIWQDDVLGTVMTGEMSAAEMQRLASLAYSGLEATRGA